MQKYRQIIDYILRKISTNEIGFQQRLPTIRELSEKFKCSKVTVVRAYTELQKMHIVYALPQNGYFLINKNNGTCLDSNTINFSSASPDESILPYEDFQHCLNRAIVTYKESLFNYSNSQGLPNLISLFAKYLQDYQVFSKQDNLFITAGSQQAINILCNMNFPNNRNTILVEQPTYTGVLNSLQLNSIPALGIKRGFNGIDLCELERIFATNTIKCFYTTPRFHNPLGTNLSNDKIKSIVKLAHKYDVYIIEDDYLADLEVKNTPYPMYYHDLNAKVIYIKSFSKVLLPGLRIAIVVLPSILIDVFKKHKRWTDLGTSILSQGALEIYIKCGMFEIHKKKIKKIYAQKMQFVQHKIKATNFSHIQWHVPNTGFFTCLELPNNIVIDDLIKNVSNKNVLITSLKDNYLNNYLTSNLDNTIVKLSLSKTSIKNIDYGIDVILSELQNLI